MVQTKKEFIIITKKKRKPLQLTNKLTNHKEQMTQLFDSYTIDIGKSFSSIKLILSQFKQSPLSKKQAALPSVKIELYEIEKLIKLMETEIVTFTGRLRNSMSQKIKSYKLEFDTMRKKVALLQEEIQKQRLISSSTPNTTSHSLELNQTKHSSKSRSKYTRLQQSSSKSDEQDTVNSKLKQSVKVMHEISGMSDNISYELNEQTNKIQHASSKLGRIRGELVKGEKKIKKIMIRLRRNQFVLCLVILMVALMAAFLIANFF